MSKKRIATLVAGASLAASAMFAPSAFSQTDWVETDDGTWGTLQTVNVQQGGDPSEFQQVTFFIPSGERLLTEEEATGAQNSCFTQNADSDADVYNETQAVGDYVTIDGTDYPTFTDNCDADGGPVHEEDDEEEDDEETTDPTEESSLGGSAALGLSGIVGSALLSSGSSEGQTPGDNGSGTAGSTDLSSGSSGPSEGSSHDTTAPNDGSGMGGSAALGLSGLAGSALLSSGSSEGQTPGDNGSGTGGSTALDLSSGSSTDDNGQTPAPTTTPEAPGTGGQGQGDQSDFVDHKAIAQQQAENAKYVPAQQVQAKQQAPATAGQQTAPAQAAQQKQLANTGVEGTMIALAVGLIAAAAGTGLLVLRRRSA